MRRRDVGAPAPSSAAMFSWSMSSPKWKSCGFEIACWMRATPALPRAAFARMRYCPTTRHPTSVSAAQLALAEKHERAAGGSRAKPARARRRTVTPPAVHQRKDARRRPASSWEAAGEASDAPARECYLLRLTSRQTERFKTERERDGVARPAAQRSTGPSWQRTLSPVRSVSATQTC